MRSSSDPAAESVDLPCVSANVPTVAPLDANANCSTCRHVGVEPAGPTYSHPAAGCAAAVDDTRCGCPTFYSWLARLRKEPELLAIATGLAPEAYLAARIFDLPLDTFKDGARPAEFELEHRAVKALLFRLSYGGRG